MPSPIERLIDQACGYTPKDITPIRQPQRDTVQLRCPSCQSTKVVARHWTDPKDAALVVAQCPECVGGDVDTPAYFRADGTETFYDEAQEKEHQI